MSCAWVHHSLAVQLAVHDVLLAMQARCIFELEPVHLGQPCYRFSNPNPPTPSPKKQKPATRRGRTKSTYSNCRSSKTSPLSWILAVVVAKVENCSIVPHQWEHKSQQKPAKRINNHVTHTVGRGGGRVCGVLVERGERDIRKPSNSTAKAW